MKTLKRTWADISLDNLEYNYRSIRAHLPSGTRFLGVMKADAYGHGAVPVSRALADLGAEYLAVSNLEEAVQIRRGEVRLPILVLGYTPAEFAANMRRREAVLLRGFLADTSSIPRASRRLLAPFLRHPENEEILFREGDEGGEMYFVRSGAVRLSRANLELSVFRAGDYFGEMSMLLGARRSATATVVEPETELVAISERNMDMILQENPAIVQRLLRDMSARLQAMNERVAPQVGEAPTPP